jgi:60 kDa SS-A/Ro ribonucleoprotein
MTTTRKTLATAARRSVSPPQSKPLRSDQVENSAGGFVWQTDTFQSLRRFLVLGSAGGTFYINEKDLTDRGLGFVEAALKEDGPQTILTIVEISEAGRAPKNDYAIFALAVAVAKGDEVTKSLALSALPRVCRIGTHLFQFASYLDAFGTLTGRAKRRAFAQWYASKEPEKLAYEVIKYRQRDGWSHRDILRLAHPARKVSAGNPTVDINEDTAVILDWVTRGWADFEAEVLPGEPNTDYFLAKIEGFERIQRAASAEDAAKLIRLYGLPREAVPTQFLKSTEVWQAMLDSGMPMTAMIRNLANMTRSGLLTQTSEATKTVVAALKSDEAIRKARIHPFNVLFALKTYASGGGFRSYGDSFKPVQKVVDALDGAFYKAFGNVEPTGKRILYALDVSGSMGSPIFNSNVTCREAAAAMALVGMNVEDDYGIIGFTAGGGTYGRAGGRSGGYGYYKGGVEELSLSPRQRLDDAVNSIARLNFGATDCALPMLYATAKGLEFDAFVVITDNETWHGNTHPAVALQDYRNKYVADARQVVIGMTATDFTIADPTDPLTLDVVGFDSATPQIISEFIAGTI